MLDELQSELERAIDARGRAFLGRMPKALVVALVISAVGAGVVGAALLTVANRELPQPAPEERRLGLEPVPGSGSIEAQAPDPGGGPPWVVRVYRVRGGETCTQVGQLVEGRIGLASRFGFRRTSSGGCGFRPPTRKDPLTIGFATHDGGAKVGYPGRTIVDGIAAGDVTTVVASAAQSTRRLRPSPRGYFLAVYPARVARVRVTAILTDGSTKTYTVRVPSTAMRERSE